MPDAPPRPGGRTVGVDVGGTFTDVVLAGPRGQEAVAKRLSTPGDPAAAVVDGVRAVLAEARVRPADVVRVVHATTLATNLVLEGRGGRVAFVTTRSRSASRPPHRRSGSTSRTTSAAAAGRGTARTGPTRPASTSASAATPSRRSNPPRPAVRSGSRRSR